MNLLIDRCPEEVEINGEVYPIASDFRTSILFEMAMSDSKLSEDEKILVALNLYYRRLPEDTSKLTSDFIEAIFRFYSLGKDVSGNRNSAGVESGGGNKKIYSFEHDGGYIYTSFLTAYGIDLNDESSDNLHWWKFRTLFNNLPEDTMMKKVVDIRTSKINSKMSREEKKRMRELKRIYELPVDIEEEEREFNDSLNSMF